MTGEVGAGPEPLLLGEGDLAFATDLYQLTMAAAYWSRGPLPRASYELYVRRLPAERNFLVFAGLEQALAALERLRFGPQQIDFLRGLAPFAEVDDGFFRALESFRFEADVWAMPEGRVFFGQEPVLRVTGNLLEGQIAETLLLSIVNFQTLIASKAARIRLAAGDDVHLAEFGTRRAHGPEAGAWGARAAYLGGFDATSNVFAAERTGVPAVGTMAHSFVLSFEDESDAFEHYARTFPDHTVHLVDTYDTLQGIDRALATGLPFDAIRLDSGEMDALSREARRRLDAAGRSDARIFVSGDMHERSIRDLLEGGAPIDAFGVGTRLVSSTDSPTLGGVYKLVEIERDGRWVPKKKRSAGKTSYAHAKQVVRVVDDGEMLRDRLVPARGARVDVEGDPLLRPVVQAGRVIESESLRQARDRCRRDLEALPDRIRSLDLAEDPYEVAVAPELSTE